MRRLTIFTILALIVTALTMALLLAAAPAYAANEQYHGGSGSGYAMAEYVGHLDGSNSQFQSRQQPQSRQQSQSRQQPQSLQGKEPQYSGGAGSGSASAEYVGRLDGGKVKVKV